MKPEIVKINETKKYKIELSQMMISLYAIENRLQHYNRDALAKELLDSNLYDYYKNKAIQLLYYADKFNK